MMSYRIITEMGSGSNLLKKKPRTGSGGQKKEKKPIIVVSYETKSTKLRQKPNSSKNFS